MSPVLTRGPPIWFRGFFPPEKFGRDGVKTPLAREILGFAPAEFTPLHFPDGPGSTSGDGRLSVSRVLKVVGR